MPAKKPTVATKTVAAKTAKLKPFEFGYEFNIKAKIVEVYPEDDEYNYPYKVTVNLGEIENLDILGSGNVAFDYVTKQDLLNVISKTVPALSKAMKLEELNKAKADVARITKELAAIK